MSDPVWWAKHYHSISLTLRVGCVSTLSGDLSEDILRFS